VDKTVLSVLSRTHNSFRVESQRIFDYSSPHD
jgi:hypothetical protein